MDFISGYGSGYTYKESIKVSDTGAAFQYQTDELKAHIQLLFPFVLETTDLSSKALFKWQWTPLQTDDTPRPTISSFILVAPDPNEIPYNIPTYTIEFPYRKGDFIGEGTPKIQYQIKGLTGAWKNLTASGELGIRESAIDITLGGPLSISETLRPSSFLNKHNVPDPVYKNRLSATYGQYMTQSPTGGLTGTQTTQIDRHRSLGYNPPPGGPELTLDMRARQSLANLAMGAHNAEALAPQSYDLRNVNGQNFVTPVKDQGTCGSCVAFGVIAAAEATLRVRRNNPNLNIDFAEADLFYCLGGSRQPPRTCGHTIGNPPTQEPNSGWFVHEALEDFQSEGVVDEMCFPYSQPVPTNPTPGCSVCDNWESHITKIQAWTPLDSPAAMKEWISGGKGALVTGFSVFDDFYSFMNSNPLGIYRKGSSPGNLAGGHCVCVVGYNDIEQCWICKNSWGPFWADSGFFKIGYAEVGIDAVMWGIDIS